MKTRMTITVDKDVKDKFQQIAKNLWSNTSTLTNMFFVSVINTWSVNYYDNIDNYWAKLYHEYINSSEENKSDEFSIKFNKKIDKKEFSKKLSENLWN